MKQYFKEENGEIIWYNGRIILNGRQIINPNEQQIFSAGYQLFKPKQEEPPSEEDILNKVKNDILTNIRCYDESPEVNNCTIVYNNKELSYWADKSDRSNLKTAIQDYINAGFTLYRLDLREIGICVEIPCDQLLQMLAALEVYAVQCYNKTTDHMFAIEAMTSIDELKTYDHTLGYPEKLIFNL